MKAVLSNRIYLEVDSKLQEHIREELTYVIPAYNEPITIRNYSLFRKGIMTIPIGRVDLIPKGYDIVDRRVLKHVDFPEFAGTLRPSQQAVYEDISDNALINAKVSWGKTYTGMAIAGKLSQKTLVIAHTIPLMHQWAKEVKNVYGFKPGIIGGGQEDYSEPITIGSVKSLYTRMDKLAKEFGTIIMDEVHHAPSPIFSKIVDRSFARYKIGLSGTLERKDGKHVVIKDYFGSKVYKPPKENSMTPVVHVYDSGVYFPDSQKLGWAAKVTMLQESIVYRNLISALAANYASKNHKVLVVSDRTEFLSNIAKQTKAALIIGSTKDRDNQFSLLETEADILCGTQSIFSEGISHDPLSCLIMSTPINNMPLLEQLIGRIVRLAPNKVQPVVVDVRLRGHTVERQFMNRLGHYMKEGYEIIHM